MQTTSWTPHKEKSIKKRFPATSVWNQCHAQITSSVQQLMLDAY